jgi:hypothetical protein
MDELIKEVYAAFGLAYYYGEVLHRGLSTIYAIVTFKSPEDVTLPRMEEKLAFAYSLTLGQLLQEAEPLLTPDLIERFKAALKKRNYLAHHFWFDRIPKMFSEEGLLEMYHELHNAADLFSKLDEDLTFHIRPTLQKFGITDERLEKVSEQIIQGNDETPLVSQRRLKKSERIVSAWNVKLSEGVVAQIFETDDGCLWQLCDVGLGWTKLNKAGSEWEINENIQKYLPASVNPRPATTDAWNYKFMLAKGAELVVSQGRGERTYKFRIDQKK